MADTLTLAQLRTRVRERADMVNSQFVTDTELNGYINYSYKALFDLLVEANEDYNLTSTTLTITSGNTAPLPANFYKLRGLDDLSYGASSPVTVRKFNWNERNYFNSPSLAGTVGVLQFSDVCYRIVGDNLIIEPEASAARSYKLWYIPAIANLVADTDTADGVQGWLEYVIVDSAIKCLIKEESDIAPLMAIKQELTERIARMRHNRDQSLPEKIARVQTRRGSYYFSDYDVYE